MSDTANKQAPDPVEASVWVPAPGGQTTVERHTVSRDAAVQILDNGTLLIRAASGAIVYAAGQWCHVTLAEKVGG